MPPRALLLLVLAAALAAAAGGAPEPVHVHAVGPAGREGALRALAELRAAGVCASATWADDAGRESICTARAAAGYAARVACGPRAGAPAPLAILGAPARTVDWGCRAAAPPATLASPGATPRDAARWAARLGAGDARAAAAALGLWGAATLGPRLAGARPRAAPRSARRPPQRGPAAAPLSA